MEEIEIKTDIVVGEKRYKSLEANCLREGQKAVFKLSFENGVMVKRTKIYWINSVDRKEENSSDIEVEREYQEEQVHKTFPEVVKCKSRAINRKWNSKMKGSKKEDKILSGNPELFGKEVETDWKWIEKHS